MQQQLELTKAYIYSLTGSIDTVCEWRVIYDKDKAQPINLKGSLAELQTTLIDYNNRDYAIFMCVNAMDESNSNTYENVKHIRAQIADIDDVLSSQDSYQRAVNSDTPPHFAVQTSVGKYHLYWLTEPYDDNNFYKVQQRKIVQLYKSDKAVTDATRVLRVPGFLHCKGQPTLVTCWGIHENPRYTKEQIENWLQPVNVYETVGSRKELGNPKLQAPNLEWLRFALNLLDPNDLAYDEWLGTSAAFKQAGWSLTDEETLKGIWLDWCVKYAKNDLGENNVKWESFRDTEVGWKRFERLTNVQAYMVQQPKEVKKQPPILNDEITETILDEFGKKKWFKNCFFIEREGKIFTSSCRFMGSTQFNGSYGGKEFCLRSAGGKTTDDAWKAALRSTDWTIPKVDHVRFLPQTKPFEIVEDDMGRKGLNTYTPAKIKTECGDVGIWTNYLVKIFNTPEDVKIFNDYVAHCIKFPGWKIPWSVLLQSTKGIGKQMIADVIKRCIGENYTYQPDAEELVSGVSQFNGWMKNKIMMLVDEVRVGDKYDLMNGLKTIITDRRIAIESKGVDQDMEDNVSNWIFFSNFKDAFPIDENERRYCIFYSKLQNARDLTKCGLDKSFFDKIYHWLECEKGYQKLAYFYLNYPLDKGSLSHRAPKTSSYDEVIRIGRSPARLVLDDKIEAKEKGFRGGFVSFTMYQKAVLDSNMRNKPADHILKAVIEAAGYEEIGYTTKPVSGEDFNKPSLIYSSNGLDISFYEHFQITA